MDPVFTNVHSYPYQSMPRYYPGADPFAAHMPHMVRQPINYGCWPWDSSYGYSTRVPCHGCCNHTCMPCQYGWGSPYSHVPQHHNCPASHPSFPAQCVPPLAYAMEQPRYGYEKVPRDQRCCGCPNHASCHQEQNNVRIEEHDPDDKQVARDSSLAVKPSKNQDQKPAFLDGCHPLDLSKLVSSKGSAVEERTHHLRQGNNKDFPVPLVWIPCSNLEHKGGEEPTVPSKPRMEENSGGQVKEDKQKEIPVMEVRQHVGKDEEKDASLKSGKNNEQKKPDNAENRNASDGAGRRSSSSSSSSPKSSKLPPVCLRVDPVPKRKGANGNSRSPSPPLDKEKPDKLSIEATKVLDSSPDHERSDKIQSKVKENKGDTKTVKVVEGKTQGQSVDVIKAPGNVSVGSPVKKDKDDEKPEEHNISVECIKPDGAVTNESMQVAKEVEADEAKKSTRRALSENEAAVIIQSVYRGFDTRRWESLKKLKQIAQVREQIAEVKQLMQAMESSSDAESKKKQKNVIGETIMSLLLKLDTIQGLHPSVREVRKSVVKELVSLQEKLDSLLTKESVTASAPGEMEDIKLCQMGNETAADILQAQQRQSKEETVGAADGCMSEELAQKLSTANEDSKSNDVSTINEDGKRNDLCDNNESSVKQDDPGKNKLEQSCESDMQANSDPAPVNLDESMQTEEDIRTNSDPALANLDESKADTGKDGSKKQPEEDHIEAQVACGTLDDETGDNACKGPSKETELQSSGEDVTSEANEASSDGSCIDDHSDVGYEVKEAEHLPDSAKQPEQGLMACYETLDDDTGDNAGKEQTEGTNNASVLHSSVMDIMSEDNPDRPGNDSNSDVEFEIKEAKHQDDQRVGEHQQRPNEAPEAPECGNAEALNRNREEYIELNKENERLRSMMEEVMKLAQEQLSTIASLSCKVKELERKVSRKRKPMKVKRNKVVSPSMSSSDFSLC